MKVFGITCGRKNGNTDLMMIEAFRGVKEVDPNAECSFVNLQDAEIKSCIGCETCMKKKLAGDYEFRCVHGVDGDHFHFLEMKMREADAIIVGAPAYNLLPPGIMIRFLNKMHASGDYRKITQSVDICKIGACYSIGGTDWTDYMPNVMRMIVSELVGVYDGVVDAVHFDFYNAFQTIMISPEVMDRIHQLGVNVANAAKKKAETGKNSEYVGDFGICPYCHSNLLRIFEDGTATCPECNVKADVVVEDGKIRVSFTPEALEKSRWAPWGQKEHLDNIAKGHKKAAMGADEIKENYTKNYKDDIPVYRLNFPALEK